ncbi:MAG: DUF4254 domain-containing protein [Opitutus sp.]|nr:DUF4254 domain-containing protein [Opitutus sp.]
MTNIAADVTGLQARLTRLWHDQPTASLPEAADLLRLAGENHRRNFDLWHAEDEARRDDLGAAHVYRTKRAIDRLNQERNDFIQRMDEWLINELHPPTAGCPLNSETPGMMIDRLSILALKSYHMAVEAERTEATPEHRQKAAQKLAIINRQRGDLQACLQELPDDIARGRRTFRVYFQFKMYNDPTLNPALYAARGAPAAE